MTLKEIRGLPNGQAPQDDFKVQVSEIKKIVNNAHSKVSLTDASVSSFSAFVFGRTDLEEGAWYDVTVGQDNRGRERVRVEDEEFNGRQWKELKIDGTALAGPIDGPPMTLAGNGQAQGAPAPRGRLGTQEVLGWLRNTAPEVRAVVETLNAGESGTEARVATIECSQRLLTTLLIQVLDGRLEMETPEGLYEEPPF